MDDVAGQSVGEQMARAIGAGDREALLELLAPDLDFRAMTPLRFWESRSAEEVADIVLGTWFGGDRHLDALEQLDTDVMADRERVGYRFRATTPEGVTLVEQQAYVGVDAGRVSWLRIMCTGFRPTA
jgi:hypothetical protein